MRQQYLPAANLQNCVNPQNENSRNHRKNGMAKQADENFLAGLSVYLRPLCCREAMSAYIHTQKTPCWDYIPNPENSKPPGLAVGRFFGGAPLRALMLSVTAVTAVSMFLKHSHPCFSRHGCHGCHAPGEIFESVMLRPA